MAELFSRKSAAKSRRVSKAIEGFKTASEVIGTVEPGMSLFAITRGQISMIDVISHLLSQVGPSHVTVWTWCIADYEIEAFEKLLSSKQITGGGLIVDRSAEQRNVELLDRWRNRFGEDSVRIVMNHAKIATVSNERFKLLARGSMNLNFNPRFEQFDISEGDAAYDLVKEIEAEIPILPRLSSRRSADEATGIKDAWSQTDLKPFSDVKVWAK